MLLLEGIGTIVFGLWVMSQGTEAGASILIIIGLPIVLFGIVLTFIGFARAMKEETPVGSEPGPGQAKEKHGRFPAIEDEVSFAESVERKSLAREQDMSVRTGHAVHERQSRRRSCPECGTNYGLIDLVGQPTMCSKCWKKSTGGSAR